MPCFLSLSITGSGRSIEVGFSSDDRERGRKRRRRVADPYLPPLALLFSSHFPSPSISTHPSVIETYTFNFSYHDVEGVGSVPMLSVEQSMKSMNVVSLTRRSSVVSLLSPSSR